VVALIGLLAVHVRISIKGTHFRITESRQIMERQGRSTKSFGKPMEDVELRTIAKVSKRLVPFLIVSSPIWIG
jgi:hypothetical protein